MDKNKVVKQIAIIKQIADWMIEGGTENTTEGNWIFYTNEIAEKFGITKNWITACREEIVDALYEHEAVADVIYNWGIDDDVKSFDIDFYLSYCPNLSDED